MTAALEVEMLTEEANLIKKREAIRKIAKKIGPEALADFEQKFGKKEKE